MASLAFCIQAKAFSQGIANTPSPPERVTRGVAQPSMQLSLRLEVLKTRTDDHSESLRFERLVEIFLESPPDLDEH
jgi:hypothetical protein